MSKVKRRELAEGLGRTHPLGQVLSLEEMAAVRAALAVVDAYVHYLAYPGDPSLSLVEKRLAEYLALEYLALVEDDREGGAG